MSRVTDILAGKRRISDDQKVVYDNLSPRDTYRTLEFYYLSNGLYALLHANNGDDTVWTEGMLGLRNPAHRVVEFYVGAIWPGDLPDALPIVLKKENETVRAAIQQVWEWSNWASEKQVFSRHFSNFGDAFIKVAANDKRDRVFLQLIKPEFVTELDAERGRLTYIRIDIPQTRRDSDGKIISFWHTEVWNKSDLSYRTWENQKGPDEPLDRLGAPKTAVNYLETYKIDFIPVVQAKFQDIGQKRGLGAFTHALDKIDELNRQVTRLHQVAHRYNKALWAVSANDKDPMGRPLPAPRIGSDGNATFNQDNTDETIVYLPGMSDMKPLIPNLPYDAILKIVQDMKTELMQDLPEMAYYAIRDRSGEISGRAARILLGDLLSKASEARGNAEAALARADAMALTIGANLELKGFEGLGTYETGEFDHQFAKRDIIPTSEYERAETMQEYTGAGVPVVTAARWAGKSDADIEQMTKDKQQERRESAATLAQTMIAQQRNFDRGQNAPDEEQDQEE